MALLDEALAAHGGADALDGVGQLDVEVRAAAGSRSRRTALPAQAALTGPRRPARAARGVHDFLRVGRAATFTPGASRVGDDARDDPRGRARHACTRAGTTSTSPTSPATRCGTTSRRRGCSRARARPSCPAAGCARRSRTTSRPTPASRPSTSTPPGCSRGSTTPPTSSAHGPAPRTSAASTAASARSSRRPAASSPRASPGRALPGPALVWIEIVHRRRLSGGLDNRSWRASTFAPPNVIRHYRMAITRPRRAPWRSIRCPSAHFAETLGTALLVLVGPGSVVATLTLAGDSTPAVTGADLLGISFAFGLIITALVYAIGKVSGCHINPAVTFALAATKRFPWREVPHLRRRAGRRRRARRASRIWAVFAQGGIDLGHGPDDVQRGHDDVGLGDLRRVHRHRDPRVRDPRHRRLALAQRAGRRRHRRRRRRDHHGHRADHRRLAEPGPRVRSRARLGDRRRPDAVGASSSRSTSCPAWSAAPWRRSPTTSSRRRARSRGRSARPSRPRTRRRAKPRRAALRGGAIMATDATTPPMRKFVNDPADVVKESLVGLAAAHGDLLRYDADGADRRARRRAGERQGRAHQRRRLRPRAAARRLRRARDARRRLPRRGVHLAGARADARGDEGRRRRRRRRAHRQELHGRRHELQARRGGRGGRGDRRRVRARSTTTSPCRTRSTPPAAVASARRCWPRSSRAPPPRRARDLAKVAGHRARGQRAVALVRRRAVVVHAARRGQADLRPPRGRDGGRHRDPRRARAPARAAGQRRRGRRRRWSRRC